MFVLLQRYTFWSNSQPWIDLPRNCKGCLYYCKDTLFEAIHNHSAVVSKLKMLFVLLQRYTFWSNSQQKGFNMRTREVVCITAKIHFLKQFTTVFICLLDGFLLFVLLQRYTFWSNSQPFVLNRIVQISCLYYCKDTLFEAIHNVKLVSKFLVLVVCITAKIHFLKQFTTTFRHRSLVLSLFVLLQRYTFWSNSQHVTND